MVYCKLPAQAAIKTDISPAIDVRQVAWQPGHGGVLALSTNRGGKIVKLEEDKAESVEFGTDMAKMTFLAWSPDGDLLATIGEQNVIWNLSGIKVATLQDSMTPLPEWGSKPHFNNSGRLVLVVRVHLHDMSQRYFDIFDSLSGIIQQTFDSGLFIEEFRSFHEIAWKHEQEFFARGAGQTINLWRVGEDDPIKIITGHKTSTMAFNSKWGILASGGRDGTVCLWNPDLTILPGHTSEVLKVIWLSLSYGVLASYDTHGKVQIWNALSKTLQHVYKVSECEQDIFQISFSPDGRFFAAAVCDENVKVLKINSGETVAVCEDVTICEENGEHVNWMSQGTKLAVRSTKEGLDMINFDVTFTVNVNIYNLENILEKKLKDIAMRKVVELLKKNLTKGKSEAEDVLTKEGIPEALKTEICLQFSGLQALN